MILDTNALSAAADREPAALEVVARAERLAVPVIVLGEYRLNIQVTTDIGTGVTIQTNSPIPTNSGLRQPTVGYARVIRVQRFGRGQIGV